MGDLMAGGRVCVPGQALRPTSVRLRVVTAALLLLTFGLLCLEAGFWSRSETLKGPFPSEAPTVSYHDNKMLLATAKAWGPFRFLMEARGDRTGAPAASLLRLHVDGRDYATAHADHNSIRAGETGVFSHRGNFVRFALPAGQANGPDLSVTLTYPLQPIRWITPALLALLLGSALLISWPRLSQQRATQILAIPGRGLLVMAYAGLVATALFAAGTIVAWLSGAALPSAALIRATPIIEWLALNETRLPYVLIMLAMLAAAAQAVAQSSGLPSRELTRDGLRLQKILGRWGFVLLTAWLLFAASVPWAGLFRPTDFAGASLFGLLPFNDAAAYFSDAHDQARDGVWSSISVRRPIAAAMRTALMFFSMYSYALMVALQVILLAGTTAFAAASVARFKGVWAAIVFTGIIALVARSFLTSALTEPLGLSVALAFVPFFIAALRTKSEPLALLAFAGISVALMIRMGSMFTIPALLLWMVICFAATVRDRVRVAASGIGVLVAIYAVNFALTRLYAASTDLVGSNFAHTICGLTIGEVWSVCQERYLPELKGLATEKALSDLLYVKAWENFQQSPVIFFKRLAAGIGQFVSTLPGTLLTGYISDIPPFWYSPVLLFAVLLVGGAVSAYRSSVNERIFWTLLWVSISASAAIVIFDDGRRVLMASYPLIALFLVLGFVKPRAMRDPPFMSSPNLVRSGVLGLAGLGCVLLVTPMLAYAVGEPLAGSALTKKQNANEHVVLGGRRLSGVQVVEDPDPRFWVLPTIGIGDFKTIVRRSGFEHYQGLVTPVVPSLPFGFVAAPRAKRGEPSDRLYIVPAHVLQRPDVTHWVFTVEDWQLKPPSTARWYLVTKAEPLVP